MNGIKPGQKNNCSQDTDSNKYPRNLKWIIWNFFLSDSVASEHITLPQNRIISQYFFFIFPNIFFLNRSYDNLSLGVIPKKHSKRFRNIYWKTSVIHE